MKKYEIMFIVKSLVDDAEVEKVADSLKTLITADKGNIIEFKNMGKRKLAYPIKKELTGTYYLMNVEAKPETIKEFDRKVKNNENVLRHLILNKEGE